MFERKKLSAAIISVLASTGATAANEIEEVVVTATKRASSTQDIPVAVQAVTEDTLEDLAIGNFEDYIRYLPNVTAGGRGPGQNTAYIRGMAVEPITVLLSGAQGTAPNVAMYLDEQPVTAPARNLDLYATDVQRVEVLPGPQGTLFGASSQAGTIRLITNKPEFDGFDIGVDLSLSSTEYGEESETVETFINIPVNDRIAFRAAMYSAEEGGYIDNVPGTFTTNPSVNPASLGPAPRVVDPDTGEVTGSAVSYATANNTALVEEDFNDAEYKGARFSMRGLINEDWDVLLQHSEQELRADGVFDYDPAVGDLQASRFFPDSLDDEFGLTAWTLTGRLGMLDVVYTGGYLDREIEQSVDYTGYNNSGGYIAYYTCTYSNPAYITNYGLDPDAGYVTPGGRECRDPVKGAVIYQTHERNTHEVRINTPQDKKVRVTAGFFYDDFQLETQDDYHYAAIESLGFVPNLPMSTAVKVNPNARGSNVAFFNDVRRMEEQMAIFGEVSYDFSEKLELIAGFRYYDMEIDFEGSSNFGDGIFQGSAATNGPVNKDRGRDYDISGGHTKEPLELDDVILKFTANYKLNDDMLIYGTYSEGFRPGGWNRGGGIAATNPAYPTVSSTYESDDVQNYEFGWKMTLMDGAMRFNGNAYYVDWTDMQVTRFDPQNVSILTFVENAADATIKGIEGDLIIKPNENLTVFGGFSFNDTELKAVYGQAVELAPVGSELPLTPNHQLSLRVRYDWFLDSGWNTYAMGAIQTAGTSYSSVVAAKRVGQDNYTQVDASIGAVKESWKVELFAENMTNERAELFINDQDDTLRIATNRPLTLSLRVSYDL